MMHYADLPGEAHFLTKPTQPICERRAVQVRGVVQGVGFRPFVYRLATEERLAGWIGNDTDGVTIEVEGPETGVASFLRRLRAEAPPLARIDAVAVHAVPANGENSFRILASEVLGRVSTGIPADAATCADCLRELAGPRRPPLPLSVSELHQLRAALHHYAAHSLRPAADFDGAVYHVRGLPGRVRRSRQPALPRAAQCMLAVRSAALAGGLCRHGNSRERPRGGRDCAAHGGRDRCHQGHRRISSQRGRDQPGGGDAAAGAQAPLWQAAGRDGERSGCRAGPLRAKRRGRVASADGGAPHRAGACAGRQRHCGGRGAGDSVAGRLSALCAAAASALCLEPSSRAGDDQRQSERGADRDRQRRSAGAAGRYRRCFLDARPRDPAALRRLGSGGGGRRAATDAPRARICAAGRGVSVRCAAAAGRGRALEERLRAGAGNGASTRASTWATWKT